MEFKKLTEQEINEWNDFVCLEYCESDVESLEEDDFVLLCDIMLAALNETFDWLTMLVSESATEIDRLSNNEFFMSRLIRAYEHGVACDHAGCCCNLANKYHNTSNQGSDEDYAIAVSLYRKAADLGDAQASINLGYIYYYGRGCQVDYAKAYECYARGALLCDHPEAYWKLGDLYASGKGVDQSDWIAWLMYSKAYKFGKNTLLEARAAHHMADYLLKGIPGMLDKDPERALKLYTRAELSYYHEIDRGLTYYSKCLQQAIEGQELARQAVVEMHQRIRKGK